MKKITLFLLSLIYLSCSKDDIVTEAPFIPKQISYQNEMIGSVGGGTQNGFPANGTQYILNNSNEYNVTRNLFINSILDVQVDNNSTINFSNTTAIAILGSIQNSGIYKLNVINITEYEANIKVQYNLVNIFPDAQPISNPFTIVKIPKTNKPIVFEQV